ncbi:dihydrolipoyl dehydrogenase [Massilia eurypsychrophila]|uniref:Dihydrolipoyl dehydrogenase n=1 Tax=Massilia eurypsychrophila TaxID=1485217 RepID=A0A2G8TKX0_9BURK|nr:dihydrolipoyl dehydrogenase [Massilia eurypsychrophila]PIL46691.1 dihydrolipoyl dehydrogenase [Massilia eurypsychrophila]
MKNIDVDVAIIGAGTAGLSAYRSAVAQGARTVLIEGGPYGTTCARVGCMPSKLLIAAADAAHMLQAAPGFGVHPGEVRIDGRAVMERVRRERDRFVGFVVDGVERIPEADRLVGQARFTAAHTLQVGEHTTVQAARVVIATGSTPFRLPQLADGGPGVIVSDDIFEMTDLPQSMAVIGTGVIGLELGQAMSRLGVRVSFFARGGSLAQLTDPDVLHDATRVLGAELDVRFQNRIIGASRDGDGVLLVSHDAAGAEHRERFDYVLMAAGRAPNVGAIGIEHTGLELDKQGIPLFDRRTMQCGASHIFIAGDADNDRPVLPEAADQGCIAGANAGRYPDVRPGLRRTALTIAFTEPQIATVGAGYRELCADGRPKFALGMVSFENQGRSRVMLQNHGMLRVYGEYGTGRFLGAEMIGPRAEHIGHLLAWACQARMTVDQMLDMPFYHPVVEEGVRTALRALHAALAKGAPDQAAVSDAPGV